MLRKLVISLAVLIALAAVGLVLFVRGAIGGDAVRRAIEEQLSVRAGRPVRIASLGASFFPRVSLDLHGVSIGEPATATIGEVSVATGLRGLFSRRVEDAEVIVSNGRLPLDMVFGIVGAAAGGSSASTEGLTILSVRTLVLRGVELVAGPRVLRLDLESSLAGDRLDVTRVVAEAEGTRLEAHGALTSVSKREGQFTATAGRLNLDDLIGLMSDLSAQSGPEAARTPPLNLTIDLTAPGGELGGYGFQSLSSSVHIAAAQVRMRPLRFGMFGGDFDGELRVTPSGGSAAALALNGRIARLDVAAMLRETRGSAAMSGRMSGTVSISGRGSTAAEILGDARGTGQIVIADGAIPGLEMVRSVVLAFGKPSGVPPAGSGSAFTRLAGTFSLVDRTLRSEDVSFASRDFDMVGRAVVGFPAGTLNMHANVVLSRELTAQAGTDLRRYAQADGRVIVPAVITGTIAEPRVTIDVAAALNRAVQNEIKRTIQGWIRRIIK